MGGWGWVGAGAVVLVLLLVADRVVAWTWHKRAPRPTETPRQPLGGLGGAGLGDVLGVFQPNIEHLIQEQERQRNDLVEVGDAAPPWTVDLESGTVTVPAARAGADQHRRLREVATGVWVTTAETWTTQTTVVVAEDRTCLVVDPGLTVDEVTALADELAARGWRPVAGFSTHPHWDHVLWHRSLGDVPRFATGTGALAAAQQRASLAGEADDTAPGHDHALTAALTPLPDDVGDLPWQGPRVVVVPYPGHCAGSAALVVPEAGVLVAGDMLSDVEIPLLGLDTTDPVGDYRSSLDVLESAAAEHGVRWVVPGHGHVGDASELARRLAADRAYLDALTTRVQVDDPRLADPAQAAEHARQRADPSW